MKFIKAVFFVLVITSFFCFIGCTVKKNDSTVFQLMPDTGINFSNEVKDTKDFNILTYRNFYNGGGVAIGDINNDGLADVFFTSNMSGNRLYLNRGNFKFQDISAAAGIFHPDQWSTGVVMADVNGDGWLDIFVCNAGYINKQVPECKLYINNHNNTFTDSAAEYGLTNKGGYTTHAAFFDYDMDGDLDCFIINNSFIPVSTLNYTNHREVRAKDWPVADFLKGGGDHLYRNDHGKFVDVSEKAGIHGSLISFGLGVTVGDVNGDGYPDVYVSNDFFERDYLYINQRDGTFKDQLEDCMQHLSLSSMGADLGDVNNDGYPDLFTTDMLPSDEYRLKTTTNFDNVDVYNLKANSGFYRQFTQNTLQLNNRNGKFMEIANYSGVSASDWSWGGLFFDADNDGYSDLFVCNGINHDVTNQDFIDFFANDFIQKMVMTGKKEQVDEVINKMPSTPIPNKLFRNMGDLQFSDIGAQWGLGQPSFSNGAAYGDLDNDGDLDLVTNNVNEKAFVYRNNSSERAENHFIGFLLKGAGENTFAVGSMIRVYADSEVISREVMPSRGFQSSVDYKTIIGLGKRRLDSVEITWPDRAVTMLVHPRIDTVLLVNQSSVVSVPPSQSPAVPGATSLLAQVKQVFDKHKEDDYIDFYTDRLIPMMVSKEGPRAAVGDVNGDGLDDVFICGASGQPGQLYVQTMHGFEKKEESDFNKYASFEDVSCTFFDCDGDGDLDLFVGSGGNAHPAGSIEYQNRLYINDGKGNFTINTRALSLSGVNNAVVVAGDFDGDGDSDLFVGSRSVPGNYGPTPPSFLYMNDGRGNFTDIAKTKNKDIENIGLVTGAVWADVTGDGHNDLVIVGEWMTPKVFTFEGDHFVEVKTNMDHLFGWWQTVAAADIDGDGKSDLILGNIGENFYLRPSEKEPVKMWIGDVDDNGTQDKIITRTVGGKDVTVFLKKDITDQISSLRKQNLRYEDFATKSIQELFPEQVLQKCYTRIFNYPSSCIAFNRGGGQFEVLPMPAVAQFSSVNAILSTDVNQDGRTDLVLGGNKFDFQPQFGRLDASLGTILLNNGNRSFSVPDASRTGLQLTGEVRDIKAVKYDGRPAVLILQNNDYPLLYDMGAELRKNLSVASTPGK